MAKRRAGAGQHRGLRSGAIVTLLLAFLLPGGQLQPTRHAAPQRCVCGCVAGGPCTCCSHGRNAAVCLADQRQAPAPAPSAEDPGSRDALLPVAACLPHREARDPLAPEARSGQRTRPPRAPDHVPRALS